MSSPQKPFSESGSSPPVRVLVTSVSVVPGCTVALGRGLDKCGRAVSFVGDWRPMLAISELLDAGRTVDAYLHDWQVLAWLAVR